MAVLVYPNGRRESGVEVVEDRGDRFAVWIEEFLGMSDAVVEKRRSDGYRLEEWDGDAQ